MKVLVRYILPIYLLVSLVHFSCQKELSCENCTTTNNPGPAITTNNKSPVAKAGIDILLFLPVDSTSLNGSASYDPDGRISSYYWRKISGPLSSIIVNPTAVQTQVTNLVQGIYQFELTVRDTAGLFSNDTVQVTINAIGVISCVPNNRPVINAQLVPIGTLSQGRVDLVTATAGNKILFAGGFTPLAHSTRVDIYDVSTNKWSTAELSMGRMGMTAASVGNKIFFAGGGDPDNETVTSRVDIYDASTDRWSTAELSQGRTYIASATLGNKIFFAGGAYMNYPDVSTNRVDIYDNSTDTWTTASLSEARSALTATVADNKIYFAGGSGNLSSYPSRFSNRIDIYDGVTNSWSTSSLDESRMYLSSIAVGNKIYWAGGFNGISANRYTESCKVEIRDIKAQISTYEYITPKSRFSTVLKDDNIIFFTGFGFLPNQFDVYNISTDIWSIGKLNNGVSGAAIISVNNKIYVAGGTDHPGVSYFTGVWTLEF